MTNLMVLCGIPGSGKSTWARTLFDLKYSIISSDKIRTRQAGSLKAAHRQELSPWDEFYRCIEESLNHNVDVIADATFLTIKHRTRILEVAEKTNAKSHLVLFKNIMEAIIRNENRDEDLRVPDEVMGDMTRLYYDTLARLPQEPWTTVTKIESVR